MKAPETRAPSSPHALLCRALAALCLLALVVPAASQAGDEAAVARQQRAREAKLLVDHGRQLLASRAYAEARDAFRKALALVPGDAACARLLARTEHTLGIAPDRRVLEHAKGRRESTARLMAVQLDTVLFEAERELATHPERAAGRARRVLEGVAYLHDAERAAELKRRAEDVLAKATAASERRLDEVRRRDLAKVKAESRKRADAQATRLRALRDQGWRYLEDGNQEKALEAVEAMRRIDPVSPDALKLHDELRLIRLTAPTLQGRSKARKQRDTELLRDLDREMLLPKPGKVVLRGEKTPVGRGPLGRPMEPWEGELRAKLEQPVDMEFRGTPLGEAVRQIADVAEVNIIVDPEAKAEKTPVHISRSHMPAGSLLRWVGRFASLEYSLRDGVVVLARPGGALDEPVRRSYDIASLVTPANEARPLPEVGPVEPIAVAASAPAPPEEVNPDVIGQGWADYLRSTIAPETWDRALQEAPRYTIAYRNGRIVVVHSPEVHQQIEQLLNNFRRARNLQVHMIGRFIEITSAYMDSFDLSLGATSEGTLDPIPYDNHHWTLAGTAVHDPERELLTRFPNFFAAGGGLNLQYNYLGDDDVQAILQAVIKKRHGTVLTAPRLTCFNTQRSNLQVLVNYNYVRRVTTDDEPEIGNVPEGIIFDIQPFVSADRRYITLILQPQIRELVELATYHYTTEVQVIDQGNVSVGIIQESYVQLPTTRLRSVGTTVTTPNGGTILIGGFSEVEERHAVASIPILEHIPLLGRLVRGWDQAEGRRSLIMLVSAETVPDIFSEED